VLSTVELSDTAWINILPIGTIYDRRYGKVVVDKALIDKMVSNYKAGIPAYQLSVDLDHEGGKAYGWIKELEARDDGLYAFVEFNQDGANLIKEGEYKYVSAEWDTNYLDKRTGKEVGPTLLGFALTNRPAHPEVEELKLMESVKEKVLTFAESLKNIFSKNEQTEVHKLPSIKQEQSEVPKLPEVKGMDEEVKKQLVDLSEANKALSEKIDVLLKERKELADRLFAERKQAWKQGWVNKGVAPAMMDKIEALVLNEEDFKKFDTVLETTPKIDLSVKGTEIPHDLSDIQRAENVGKAIYGGVK